MPSERARPLVAFVAVAVVCALVVSVNMLRNPTATLTTVEASTVAGSGPRVEFGTVLARRPEAAPVAAANVLAVALRRPLTASPRSAASGSARATVSVRERGVQARRTARPHTARPHAARPHRARPASTRHHQTPHRTRHQVRKPRRPGHGRSAHVAATRQAHGQAHGRSHGQAQGHAHGHGRAARSHPGHGPGSHGRH
ncbi:MAG: hypothetical protein ACTHNS_03255 [Marmoricola sp.]